MNLVLQRVARASVTVDGTLVSSIEKGFLILVGVRTGDTEADARTLADKCAGLRIFEDASGKMNLSLADVGGSILAVSNFTLCADCTHGRRPSFSDAARPESAKPLFDRFVSACAAHKLSVSTGVFGADMKLELLNDGPVTLIMDSAEMGCKA
ncbi:MAG: D-aminoacyl-tRNA deacylase [Clostridiaceae bacterium]|nr:D-aminoacyl-tRNA deacylase [Clostridiaceae bacterium]